MDRRVVVTGTGVISSVGNSTADFWDSLKNGRSGIGPVTRFECGEDYRTRIAGEVKNFDIERYMSQKEAKRLDEFCHFAVAAADEAMGQAGLRDGLGGLDPDKVGVLVGSGIGGILTLETQANVLLTRGPTKNSPLMIPMLITDMASGCISMRYGAKGPNFSISSACATACHAIGESFWIVKRGDADVMITGGSESTITPLAMAGFCSMKAMSQRNEDPLHASRPFDAGRDGFVMAEGAGLLVLEEYEHARRRGADVLAEIIGYGATADAYHITSPSPGGEGAAKAMAAAARVAGVIPEKVGYVNAHGTSTPLNDKFETAALKTFFGEHARKVAISSTKSMTGHALGAAGGIETIACILALRDGVIPPTTNYEHPDPECDLDYTANTAVERAEEYAFNINLGFGGHNAVLAIKKV
ncbi:MAG: beta-ketoacyl-ACP synthase II [Victivallales bacterium]|nr:beta-ketoacyl-ACP synthase II [Victivallales bacterium]